MFLNENFPYYMNHIFTFKKHFNSNSQISDFCQMIIKFWEVFRSTESELLILSPMWRSIDFIILFFISSKYVFLYLQRNFKNDYQMFNSFS